MIEKKVRKIRNYINIPQKQFALLKDRAKWNQLCASMDVIEDTQMAINSYFALDDFGAFSGGYLYLYGLLQAFYLQQDAISDLHVSLLGGKSGDFKKLFPPELALVRELRNAAVGHPTNTGKSFHFISRPTIRKDHFQLISSFKDGSPVTFQEVNVLALREQQEKSTGKILDKVIRELEKEMGAQKKKFKGKKLADLIPPQWDYAKGKVFEGIWSNYPLARPHFEELCEVLEKIKTALNERYNSYEALQGIKEHFVKIDHCQERMSQWFKENKIHGNKDAEIFMDAFGHYADELFERLKELDEDWK